MQFYVGLHQPHDARHFWSCCISVNRLRGRRSRVVCPNVLIDSGAFTELDGHGAYRSTPAVYAAELRRLVDNGIVRAKAAVAQDYMCEPRMLARTGLSIAEHQRLTVERYDALMDAGPPCTILPVIQGYATEDYLRCIDLYGQRLKYGAWVGVGSVCKRNANPQDIANVLLAVAAARPDLKLHGFGVKLTAFGHKDVRRLLYSADSMAWSFAARREGRDANSWLEAYKYSAKLLAMLAAAKGADCKQEHP